MCSVILPNTNINNDMAGVSNCAVKTVKWPT